MAGAEALQVVAEIEAQGGSAFTVQADIADEAQVVNMFARLDHQGTLRVLVNNAGILFTQCRVEELTAERIQHVFATNVTGSFGGCAYRLTEWVCRLCSVERRYGYAD